MKRIAVLLCLVASYGLADAQVINISGKNWFDDVPDGVAGCTPVPCDNTWDPDYPDGVGVSPGSWTIFEDVDTDGLIGAVDNNVASGSFDCCTGSTLGNFSTTVPDDGSQYILSLTTGVMSDPYCETCNNTSGTYVFTSWSGTIEFIWAECEGPDSSDLYSTYMADGSGKYNVTLGSYTSIETMDYQIQVRPTPSGSWANYGLADRSYGGFSRNFSNISSGTYEWRVRTDCPSGPAVSAIHTLTLPTLRQHADGTERSETEEWYTDLITGEKLRRDELIDGRQYIKHLPDGTRVWHNGFQEGWQ